MLISDVEKLPPVNASLLRLNGRSPSKYQENIFKFIAYGSGNAIVNAVAGSGKSSTLDMAYNLIPKEKSVRFLAFNKHIEIDLSNKGLPAKTMHAEGYAAWRNHINCPVKVDDNKVYKTILSKAISTTLRSPLKNLIQKAKIHGLIPYSTDGLIADTFENWILLAYTFGIELPDNLESMIELARKVLQASNLQHNVIDFADMVYLPIVYNTSMPKYDFLFVDELQDLNPLQHALVSRMISDGGRFIGVGDPYQSCYGFSGADVHGIEKAFKTFNAISLPLSISYRCPKSVVNFVKGLVPHIEHSDWAIEGKIENKGINPKEMKPNDMIVCRYNTPLVTLTYALLKQKVACKMLGRDIGKGLVTLINNRNAKTLPELVKKLEVWLVKEIKKAKQNDQSTDHLEDKYGAVMVFVNYTKAKTPNDVVLEIENMFSDEDTKGVLRLSSVHKAKGLEANSIYVLNRHAFTEAYKRARTPDQKQQENNIEYIAYTRTKNELSFIELDK